MSENNTPFSHSRDSTLVDSPIWLPAHLRNRSTMSNTSNTSSNFDYVSSIDPEETLEEAILSFYSDPEPHPSEYRIPHKPLLQYIQRCGLVTNFRDRITDVVKILVYVGNLLFPTTDILNDEIKNKVLHYTEWVERYLRITVKYLQDRIDKTNAAFCQLPSPAVDKEHLALSIAKWTETIESLHKPTGHETYIYHEISAIFASHVYNPFLQVHRNEPQHDMWVLEPHLTPISSLLREASTLAAKADDTVRAVEKEFELTMSSNKADGDNEVLGHLKRGHTPSKSAPVLFVKRTVEAGLSPLQREETL